MAKPGLGAKLLGSLVDIARATPLLVGVDHHVHAPVDQLVNGLDPLQVDHRIRLADLDLAATIGAKPGAASQHAGRIRNWPRSRRGRTRRNAHRRAQNVTTIESAER